MHEELVDEAPFTDLMTHYARNPRENSVLSSRRMVQFEQKDALQLLAGTLGVTSK
jgi:hypothetical protein